MAHNRQSEKAAQDAPKRDWDCSTRSIQVPILSNISSSLSKQAQNQTGKTLQLYITEGWTENPINKSQLAAGSGVQDNKAIRRGMMITSFLHHKQNNPSKLQMPSTRSNGDFRVWCAFSTFPLSFQGSLCRHLQVNWLELWLYMTSICK
jgi:hypothetical protein